MKGASVLEKEPARIPSVFPVPTERGTCAADPDALRELRHEVGNALTSASAYAQWLLLRRSADADDREYRALEAIRDSVARAIRLLGQSADSRSATSHSVQDLVEVAVHQMPSPRNRDIRLRRLTQHVPSVSADPDTVVQIVTNLLGNAAKYSAPGTPIDVELGRVDGKAEIIVRDRGIGFEPALTDAIFDGYRAPEASQMAAGQGIGLRVSRRLAQQAGGRLWAASAPGRETAFHLELPLADSPGAAHA